MSDFFRKFLIEDPPRSGPGGRYVALAAFGKHPGWDDHVEDLGLETESLNLAKTVLYVNGIGGQIDAGAWEKLEPAQQVPAFKHVFVWQRSGQILIGRLWSSSDGKGRKRYPMVVCVHYFGVTLAWALKYSLPVLAELEEGCVHATTAEEVRNLLNRKRATLREAIQSTDRRGEYAPVSPEQLHQIMQPPGESRREGFLRVLYQLQGQLGSFAAGTFNARTSSAAIRAQQVRVPVEGVSAEVALLFWTRFFLTHVDSGVPLLLTLPLEASWLDVTVGEPESHEFFCLRASPKSVPLVSEVPYQFSEAFRTQGTAFLEGFVRGETTSPDLQAAARPPTQFAGPPKTGGWKKWLGVGVVLAIGAVAAVLFIQKGGKQPERAGTSSSGPAAAGSTNREEASAKARLDAEAAAARQAQQQKETEAMAAAAKLKTDAEAAATERQRQEAEAARLAKEKEAARQKEILEQQRVAEEAAAKKKAEDEAKAKAAAAASAANATETKPAATAPVSAPTAIVAGVEEMTNAIKMVLVRIPNSKMWVGKYEVTQDEYQQVIGSNPSKSKNGRQPVESVSWNDATNFVGKLNELERAHLPAGLVYSLPTEAQWNTFRGDQKFEDLPAAAAGKTNPSPVGQSGPANKFGLYDVLGNVWEWCLDDTTSGQKRLKGRANTSSSESRSLSPEVTSANCGFRCVLVAQ